MNEQSAIGLGTAYAGGAPQTKDASTLFFNPASITLLDQGELQLAAHVVIPSATFNNQGSKYVLPSTPFDGLPLSGGNGGDAGVTHVISNFYLTQPIFRNTRSGDLSVGVGVSVSVGLETDYEPGWVGRYQGLRTKLITFRYPTDDCVSIPRPHLDWRGPRYPACLGPHDAGDRLRSRRPTASWKKESSLPFTSALKIDYNNNAVRYAAALEWYPTPQLTLRAGFAYDETPIRARNLGPRASRITIATFSLPA